MFTVVNGVWTEPGPCCHYEFILDLHSTIQTRDNSRQCLLTLLSYPGPSFVTVDHCEEAVTTERLHCFRTCLHYLIPRKQNLFQEHISLCCCFSVLSLTICLKGRLRREVSFWWSPRLAVLPFSRIAAMRNNCWKLPKSWHGFLIGSA